MARKPRNHVRILIYRTWAISYRMQKKVKEKQLNFMFTEMTLDSIKLVICGSGNGAHAFAGIASSLKGTDVRVLTLSRERAARWNAALQKRNLEITLHRKGKEQTRIVSKPVLVTNNPSKAMENVDLLVLVQRAADHRGYLEVLKPYITPGTIVAGLPGCPGFEFEARHVLSDLVGPCTIMNFESLPWACRTTEFGLKCTVLGTKETLHGCLKVEIIMRSCSTTQ